MIVREVKQDVFMDIGVIMNKKDILIFVDSIKRKFMVIRTYKYKVAIREMFINGSFGEYQIMYQTEFQILAKYNKKG